MGKMKHIFIQLMLPLLFVWYISGISLFSHTHIVNGCTVVHSHPNPDAEHGSEETFIAIQMLSQFQSCGESADIHLPLIAELPGTAYSGIRDESVSIHRFYRYFGLRAPPQAILA